MYKTKIDTSDMVVSPPSNGHYGAKIATKSETQEQHAEGLIGFQSTPAALAAESPGPLRTLFVSQMWTTPIDTNTQFTSIPLALAKIGLVTSNNPLSTEPWIIIVYPGTYNEPIDMLSNVSIVGMNQNCVILGAAATLTWICGTGLNVGNTANREVVGFSNFTTLGDITLTRTAKTGSTTLATFDNITMSSGQKTFRINGRTSNVSSIDDRVEITSCTFYAANYVSGGYGYVRKTDTRSNFAAFSNGGDIAAGGSLYFAKNCQDYGGPRIFFSTNAWYFSCITAATRYNVSFVGMSSLKISVICFDSCLFDIGEYNQQICADNHLSKYYVRNCTIRQNTFGGGTWWPYTPCDLDRCEFDMLTIQPNDGTVKDFYPVQFCTNPADYFVTITAGEVSHTCPTVLEKDVNGTTVATNQTPQPWAVCVTSNNSASAPIPPF
jgi:hypothetical protein